MMVAKEMFEELGYYESETVVGDIVFIKTFKGSIRKFIKFSKSFKEYEAFSEFYDKRSSTYSTSLSMRELQAINKMIEELGWFDDEK